MTSVQQPAQEFQQSAIKDAQRDCEVPVCVPDISVLGAQNKSVVIPIHGIGGPAESMAFLMKQCLGQDVQGIAPHLSGHGREDPRRYLHTTGVMSGVEDIAAVVRYAREELHAAKVTLAGFSMGAFYQLLYLEQARKDEEGKRYPAADHNVFIDPAPAGFEASAKVCARHPIAYPMGCARFRTDEIMRTAKDSFVDVDVSQDRREQYMKSLQPTSLFAYIQFMFPHLLGSAYPKKRSLNGSAKIFHATGSRLIGGKLLDKVKSFFSSDVHVRGFESSHCGMVLGNEQVASALCEEAQ